VSWHGPPADPDLPASLPVFPLPTLVFFPGTVVPLHVFELRYRHMVRDTRTGHRLIALALLKPGWESDYHGCPDVHDIGCAGRLVEVTDLPDGRFNIKLAGVCRVRFDSFDVDYPYRVARIRPLPETIPPEGGTGVHEARMGLVGAYAMLVSTITGQPAAGLDGAFSAPFHALVNTLCTHIDLPPSVKHELLRLDDVLERCLAVTALIQREVERQGRRRSGQGPPGSGGHTIH
jgi:Lon protease-like protein